MHYQHQLPGHVERTRADPGMFSVFLLGLVLLCSASFTVWIFWKKEASPPHQQVSAAQNPGETGSGPSTHQAEHLRVHQANAQQQLVRAAENMTETVKILRRWAPFLTEKGFDNIARSLQSGESYSNAALQDIERALKEVEETLIIINGRTQEK